MLKNVPSEPYLVGRVVCKAQKNFFKKNNMTTFLCHGPLPFPTIPPLLPLSPQNLLDHVNVLIMFSRDLHLYDHSAMFSLV